MTALIQARGAAEAPGPAASPAAGVYIHWPFCARKCPYCDFYTFGREHPEFARSGNYLAALLAEIAAAPERFGYSAPPEADTVYFGGGTPSLMAPEEIAAILSAVRAQFALAADSEITLEMNPTTAESARLSDLRAAGANRLSVGVQSFDDKFLKLLGRDHDAAAARRTLDLARAAGFGNLSLDLMFALPGQTLAEFESDLAAALAFEPDHISAYGLTLHASTPFARWEREGRIAMPAEDLSAEMMERLIDRLGEAGYVHYEISNWARPGRESRHNSKYWRDRGVCAFGASAHGVWKGRRYSNARDLAGYAADPNARWRRGQDAETPPETERARRGEIMMLALRRVSGVAWREIDAWMRGDARQYYARELAEAESRGLVECGPDTLRLTRRGVLLADRVMETFF